MRRLRIQAAAGPPERVDRLIAARLPAFSRRRVRELFEAGRVRCDGHVVKKGALIEPGREVDVELDDEEALASEPEPAVPVLHEDPDLLVLDKPAGRPAHALRPADRGTLANFLAARYPETREASAEPLEHGLAHRLDTGTSGVIVVARSRPVWTKLREAFRAREVEKGYVALVCGLAAGAGEIDRPIEPHPRNRRRVQVVPAGEEPGPAARAAVTRYRPLARYGGHSLLEIDIPTGVRHQIRAHLASIGLPVAGDSLYGAAADPRVSRQLLHAARIAFRHPVTGTALRIESPLPDDFRRAVAALGGPGPIDF